MRAMGTILFDEDAAAGGGESHPSRVTSKQPNPDFFVEVVILFAKRNLDDVQSVGAPTEVQVLG